MYVSWPPVGFGFKEIAFRQRRINCFCCGQDFPSNLTLRLGENDPSFLDTAIARRAGLPEASIDTARLCYNCKRSILIETELLQNDQAVYLNVVVALSAGKQIICIVDHFNVWLMSGNVFLEINIYLPNCVRCCEAHINDSVIMFKQLLRALRFVRRLYVIPGDELGKFIEAIRSVSNKLTAIDFESFSPTTKSQFDDLFSQCVPVPTQGGRRNVSRRDLLMFLCKSRQGLSDQFLQAVFGYSSRQEISMVVSVVLQSLSRFVDGNIGFNSITRGDFIANHVTPFSNHYNRCVITVMDGSYAYIPKSKNFRVLRQSFSVHKGAIC